MVDREAYSKNGIVFPAGCIPVDGFMEKYHIFQTQSCQLRGRETYIKPHLVSAWLDEIVRLPVIVDTVAALIGPDIVLWESDWSVKRAGTGDYVPWHQDSPYWNLSTDAVVSVWLALGDVSETNGAMQVVPGSHAHGKIGETDAGMNLLQAYQEGQRTTDGDCMFPFAHLTEEHGANSVFVDLKAGEFSVHSIHLVHGGGPNPSAQDRIGFVMRYMSADTRYLGAVDSVTAIRGDCLRDYFVFEPRANGEFCTEDVAALETALAYPSGFGEAKRLR